MKRIAYIVCILVVACALTITTGDFNFDFDAPVSTAPKTTPQTTIKTAAETKTPPAAQPAPKKADDFDFDFETVSLSTDSGTKKATTGDTAKTEGKPQLDDFDFDFTPAETTTPTKKAPPPPTEVKEVEFGIPVDIPYLGTILLIPFTDPLTKKSGYKAKFADQNATITIGNLIIDEGTIFIIDGKFGITGRATAFGKRATFGLKEMMLAEKKTPKEKASVQKLILGLTFTDKPRLELIPGQPMILEDTDLIFEKGKPASVSAKTTLFGAPVFMGIAFTKTHVDAFMYLPPQLPITQLIKATANTPLEKGIIQQAQMTIYNLWSKTSAAQTEEEKKQLQARALIKGNLMFADKAESTATFECTMTKAGINLQAKAAKFPVPYVGTLDSATILIDSTLKPTKVDISGSLAPTKLADIVPQTAGTALEKGSINKATIVISNIAMQPEQKSATEAEPALRSLGEVGTGQEYYAQLEGNLSVADPQLSTDPKALDNLTLTAFITKKGVTATIKTHDFPIPGAGTVHDGTIIINTVVKPPRLELVGQMTIDIPDVGPLVANIEARFTDKGIKLTGEVPQTFNYAGIALNNLKMAYDSAQKQTVFNGDATIQGIDLKINMTSASDPVTKKPTVVLTGKSSGKEFAPFTATGVPVLDSIKLVDFDADISVAKREGKTTYSFKLLGDIEILQARMKSIVNFITVGNQKGVYINAPLGEKQKLSTVFPGLKGTVFDELVFEKASLIASNLTFVEPQTGIQISKGLSFLAEVILDGPLEPAGALIGNKGGRLKMYGKILPENPAMSEFGISLKDGSIDPTAKFSLGPISVAIGGSMPPSIGINADLYFRPNPEETITFTGAFSIKGAEGTANLEATMNGTWFNAFGFNGWDLSNTAVVMGMQLGSPGIPTKLGGTAQLKVKDYLNFDIAFVADATLKNLAFEGRSNRAITYFHMAALVAQALGIPIPTPDIPGIEFSDIYVRYASQDTRIGTRVIEQGIAAKATVKVLNTVGKIDASLDRGGLKALGTVDPINILNVLKVTGRGQKQNPEVDIELSLARQLFRVSGIFNIADIYLKESFFEFSPSGIEFNFEDNLGGSRFTYKKDGQDVPLLLSRVHGKTANAIESLDFAIDITFQQYFKQYIKDQISVAFGRAKKEVEQELQETRKKIDRLYSIKDRAKADIEAARKVVESARDNLKAIDDAITKVQAALQPNQDIKSLQDQIDRLDAWYNGLPAC